MGRDNIIPPPVTYATDSLVYVLHIIITPLSQTRFVLKLPPAPLLSPPSSHEVRVHSTAPLVRGERWVIIVIIIAPRSLLKISSRSVPTRRVCARAKAKKKKRSVVRKSAQLRRRRRTRRIIRPRETVVPRASRLVTHTHITAAVVVLADRVVLCVWYYVLLARAQRTRVRS